MPQIYAYASLGRQGLGNLLLPWARAEIFAHQHGVPMIAPQWTQARIGPFIRREKDKRFYSGLFTSRDYVRGPRRWMLLLRGERVREDQRGELAFAHSSAKPVIVVFEGLKDYFEGLLPHRDFLRRRLNEILSPRASTLLAAQPSDFVIGVHARRGDRPPLPFRQSLGEGLPGMSDEWFVNAITNVRKALGYDAPARIFSDGRPNEIRPILDLPNVVLAPDNPSIVDILTMARSRVLITTAKSTFSMWSSFLGRMASLWYPGNVARLNPDRPEFDGESDLEGNLSASFVEAIRASLPSSSPSPSGRGLG